MTKQEEKDEFILTLISGGVVVGLAIPFALYMWDIMPVVEHMLKAVSLSRFW